MSSNMSGITSYFPWQKSRQQFKQTGEKILGILSVDFWFLLNIIFAKASGQCEEKQSDEWRTIVKNEKFDVPW